MVKKVNQYVTVLNRDEFKKVIKGGWNRIFQEWDWGIYTANFRERL